MAWNFKEDRPIYSQLMDKIQLRIIAGEYGVGEKLPSVRDMAAEASVNPNTMQKALTELEKQGLLFSIRTSGRFVTEDISMIKEVKENLAKEEIIGFLKKMEDIGYTKKEIINTINQVSKEMKL